MQKYDKDLTATFQNLEANKSVLTIYCTADFAAFVNGAIICMGEYKSSSDAKFEGKDNQVFVMADALTRTNLPTVLALHF